jgi:hypothetical protein
VSKGVRREHRRTFTSSLWGANSRTPGLSASGSSARIDSFVSTTGRLSDRIVGQVMTLADLLFASTPIIVLMSWLASRGIATLIEWRRERKYQAEWYDTFGKAGVARDR